MKERRERFGELRKERMNKREKKMTGKDEFKKKECMKDRER